MLLRERFLIHDVRHLGDVAAVVPFQYVDQSLHAAARHAFIGIGGQAGDAGGAGKVG